MSNRARKAIFLTFLAVFFAVGVPLALLSCGYKFRFDTFNFTKSGGLYVRRSIPVDAKIQINGKAVPNNAGILNNGTLISGLAPGKYELRVSKEGYRPFSASAEIIPLQVASFDKLVLVPETFSSYFTGDVSDFFIKGDEAIIRDSAGKLRYKNQIIAGENFEFFTADGKSVVTSISSDSSEKTKTYFLVSLSNTRVSTNINGIFWSLKSGVLKLPGEVPIQVMAPHPYDGDKLLISTSAAFYMVDIKTLTITRGDETADRIYQENSSVYFVKDNSLVGYNVILKSSTPIISVKESKLITVSPSGRKIAILWNNRILEIYDVDNKKSLRFNLEDLGDIKDIFWHKNSGYVFIHSEDNLHFLYAERENINPQVIYEGVSEAKYADNALYVLSGKEIKTLKF